MRGTSSSNGGRSEADGSDGLVIRDGDRRIRLKWHKLRRRAEDPAFDRGNLTAGLALGASLEVDLQPLADGGFVCLHDDNLDDETNGHGPVHRADRATIRQLRQTGSGAVPPLLLDDIVAELSRDEGRIGIGARVQLDLKAEAVDLTDAAVADFARLVTPVAGHLQLSGEDWPAVARLGRPVPGLALGFDPTPMVFASDDERVDIDALAAATLAMAPEAETIYLNHAVIGAATELDIDLVDALHRAGCQVDCWTIGTDRVGTETQLRMAVEAGVDQITTDTPGDLQALWATMAGRPG